MLPATNATLNATSALLLVLGYAFIRQRKIRLHRRCMIAAFGTSTLFLTSYLVYHFYARMTPFAHEGLVRILYFLILISHTLLAIIVPPLAIVALVRALRGHYSDHSRIARKALPIWLYVSLTGVVVYVMLYHYPGPA